MQISKNENEAFPQQFLSIKYLQRNFLASSLNLRTCFGKNILQWNKCSYPKVRQKAPLAMGILIRSKQNYVTLSPAAYGKMKTVSKFLPNKHRLSS